MQIKRGRPIASRPFPFRNRLAALLAAAALALPPAAKAGTVMTGTPGAPEGTGPARFDRARFDPARSLTGWLLASTIMMQRGDIESAYEALSHALTLDPRNLDLQEQALRYAAMSGHEAEAVTIARLLPENDIATLILAEDAAGRAAWPEMRRLLSRASRPGPLTGLAQPVLRAWAAASEGDGRRALGMLEEAGNFAPMRRLYALHAALIAERLGNADQTERLYRKAATTTDDPLTLQILYAQLYGGWLESRGRHPAALAAITALNLGSPLASLLIAPVQSGLRKRAPLSARQGIAVFDLQLALVIAEATRQSNAARDPVVIALRQALTLDPGLTVARVLLADTFREQNQTARALAVLDPVADSDPLAALAAQERVNIASKSGNPALEVEALHRALAILPENPEFLAQLADVETQRHNLSEAIALYTRALKASPPRRELLWPLLLGRALAEQEKGDWPATRDDMKHALDMAPDQPEVLNFVGYASVEHDVDEDQAVDLLKRALELAPNDPSIQDSYAWALLKRDGDLKAALPILVNAAEHASSDPEIGYHLGVAYWYLGRRTEAQDQWNQSLDDNPEPQDRALILDALHNGGPHLAAFEHMLSGHMLSGRAR